VRGVAIRGIDRKQRRCLVVAAETRKGGNTKARTLQGLPKASQRRGESLYYHDLVTSEEDG